MKKHILLFLLMIVTSTTHLYSFDITQFIQTAERNRELLRMIKVKKNRLNAQNNSEIDYTEEPIYPALRDARASQMLNTLLLNTLCDDGVFVYLNAQASTFFDQSPFEIAQTLLRDLNSPMEEESLALVTQMIGGVSSIFRPDKVPYDIIIPMRGSGYPPAEFDRFVMWESNTVLIRSTAYPVNKLSPDHIRIPYHFKTLGLYDKAWRSFHEDIRPSLTLSNDEKSIVTALHWYEAADCAYRAGEKRLGWNLLMKAAVFGEEETFEKVKKTAVLWFNCEKNNQDLPPPEHFSIPGQYDLPRRMKYVGMKEFEEYLPRLYGQYSTRELRTRFISSITYGNPRLRDAMLRRIGEPGLTEKEIRRECWDAIINGYMGMNAHPRAWSLIDEYPHEFENPVELKKKVQDDWIDITTQLIQAAEQVLVQAKSVTVYGHVLLRKESEDENGNATFSYPTKPLDVTIPWAFPEGSVERAKQELQKALDELKAMQ